MNKVKEIVQHVAPALAAALGGPFSGTATKYLTDKLIGNNIPKDVNIEEKLSELLQEPDNLRKTKEIEVNFKNDMQNLGIDVFKLEISESENAKEYPKSDNKPQVMISLLFLCFYFIMIFAIFFVEASDTFNMRKGENSLMGELQILFGVLTAGIGQILSFWFGGILRKPDSSKDL
ncbi:MAG: hypothetical protein OEX82_02845 [Nitrosomonas sp.]|nr:hypothetical protein [Nitrosomonas sp.]